MYWPFEWLPSRPQISLMLSSGTQVSLLLSAALAYWMPRIKSAAQTVHEENISEMCRRARVLYRAVSCLLAWPAVCFFFSIVVGPWGVDAGGTLMDHRRRGIYVCG